MSNYLKRAVGKFQREWKYFSIVSDFLLHPVKRQTSSEAMSYLETQSPDVGKSCWTDTGFENPTRTMILSVIIPAYNVEKYIVPCLESVLKQHVTFSYEVIVINDGSVDQTPQLLKQYEHDQRVSVIHQPNGGLSAARNAGIFRSSGEYLCFVDSDDELPDGALEALMSMALRENAMLSVGGFEKCLRNGTVQYAKRFQSGKAKYSTLPGFAHGRVIHHSVFRNLKFPEGYWYEDSIMAQIVHPMCRDAIYTVSSICYQYYSNESGISAVSQGNQKSLDSLWITMRLLEERKRFGLEYTGETLDYFLRMVRITYKRTMYLGIDVAQCVFVIQRMLLEQYFSGWDPVADPKKRRLQKALRENNFRKYVLACDGTV